MMRSQMMTGDDDDDAHVRTSCVTKPWWALVLKVRMLDSKVCYQTLLGGDGEVIMFDNMLRYQTMMDDDGEDDYVW